MHLRTHNKNTYNNKTLKNTTNYNKSKLSRVIEIEGQYPLYIDKNVITIIEYYPENLKYVLQNQRHARKNLIGTSKGLRKYYRLKNHVSQENVNVLGRSIDSKTNKTEIRKQGRTTTEKTSVSFETSEPRVSSKLMTNESSNLRLFFKTKPATAKERDPSTTTTISTSLPPNKNYEIESNEETEKGPFSNLFNKEKETAIEALKQGGVIIKRLRVRNGGIAIAGPGGVATAGSGGTAIVGPGGIALTHPRSLTIAGPGARVYSVPKTTDLEKLALQSGRNLEDEGVIVATGPIIYYSPS